MYLRVSHRCAADLKHSHKICSGMLSSEVEMKQNGYKMKNNDERIHGIIPHGSAAVVWSACCAVCKLLHKTTQPYSLNEKPFQCSPDVTKCFAGSKLHHSPPVFQQLRTFFGPCLYSIIKVYSLEQTSIAFTLTFGTFILFEQHFINFLYSKTSKPLVLYIKSLLL